MADKLKQLTGKNPADFEPVAYSLINNPDTDLFRQLVEKDDFLYDFIKDNVVKRLAKVCNENNYRNLISFFKYYCPTYEDFIISSLVKYADEELTDQILEIFENGTEEEKTYCAKFFSYIQDPLALEYLKKNAKSDYPALSMNCISTLASFGDREIYDEALELLNSGDDFDILEGVKILVSYGDKSAVNDIIKVLKTSHMAENIACELLYLCDLETILSDDFSTGLYILNLIINGLGETVALAQVFDFGLYDVISNLLDNQALTSECAVVLLNAKEKFITLTENDEYLYDENSAVKQEIADIKKMLKTLSGEYLNTLIDEELQPQSPFIYAALDLSKNTSKIRALLTCKDQTIILKAIEILKSLKILSNTDKETALQNVQDENIKNIILAI